MTDERYPIGTSPKVLNPDAAQVEGWLNDIAQPNAYGSQCWAYRCTTRHAPTAGGWTVRQVIHHVADSHMNSYVRLRLALTENSPTIRPYDEGAWAELPDAKSAPVEVSLALLDSLHHRWMILLRSLDSAASGESVRSSRMRDPYPLVDAIALYAWHGRHHTAHITALRLRSSW